MIEWHIWELLSTWGRNSGNLYGYVENSPITLYDMLGLATEKVDGKVIHVHANDPDPWPSQPHGHVQGAAEVVDNQGNIYSKTTRQKIGRLSKKGIGRWLKFLDEIARVLNCVQFVILPPGLVPEIDQAPASLELGPNDPVPDGYIELKCPTDSEMKCPTKRTVVRKDLLG